MPVPFAKFTRAESDAVDRIVKRARFLKLYRNFSPLDIRMDLAAVHAHTPLKLAELADAESFDFVHDVTGIAAHLDRRTGELTRHFLPRYADMEAAA